MINTKHSTGVNLCPYPLIVYAEYKEFRKLCHCKYEDKVYFNIHNL
jgi:hypothetical protein